MADAGRFDAPPIGPVEGHLLAYLHGLLAWCEDHPDVGRWPGLRAAGADAIDLIRAEAGRDAPAIAAPAAAAGPVSAHLAAVAGRVGCHPLVRAAAVARAVDDLYGHLLVRPWQRAVVEAGGRVTPGDLVVTPDDGHLEVVYGGASRAVGPGRSGDHPARTARARIYTPAPGVPPIVFDGALEGQLEDVLGRPRPLVTAHPNGSWEELALTPFPAGPRRPTEHRDTTVGLVEAAIGREAAIVALPELTGTLPVVDALRQLRPPEPTLIVAGSAHLRLGSRRANAAHVWVARERWVVPAPRPLRVLKRVPYAGSMGAEPLTQVADHVRVLTSGPWRLVVGICRDTLDADILAALIQLGVNLVVVPASSAKTANLGAAAAGVATGAPGIGLVANGPRRFPGRPAADGGPTEVDVPLGIYCSPLDRVEPRLHATCEPPGLCVFDVGRHEVVHK
ncbi:MAG TPA: hypothetical protein VFU19_08590 [Iamia sp.]|nr:hypothetical protein [Iamia sp.]